MIEWAAALEARHARTAVDLEAPGSRHNPQAVVNLQAVVKMMAGRALARSARDVPAVRSAEARDDMARSALRDKVRGCGAGLGSREVAR